MKYLIGIDIGGTKCSVILGEVQKETLKIVEKRVFLTKDYSSPEVAIPKMIACAEEILADTGLQNHHISAVGVSCGGPLNSSKGIIMSPPNLPGWENVPITDLLFSHFGVPAKLQNDANAGALAEWRFGAGKGLSNLIFITFGTGCGAGLILKGKLYSGTNDMAGECGHIRLAPFGPVGYGKCGSMEGFCSGSGIVQVAGNLVMEKLQMGMKPALCPNHGLINKITVEGIASAARKGDELAKEIFMLVGEKLGSALSILIDLLNPEMIILGSIFSRCYDLLWQYTEARIKKESLRLALNVCHIVPSKLGEQVGDYAALAVAFDAIL